MGILKLMDFIKQRFPHIILQTTVSHYQGKYLAVDASNWIYQFLIKTKSMKGGTVTSPTDWMGNQTGHLIGILSRVVFCLQNSVTPIWVFDGKPPKQKSSILKRRSKLKQQASQKLQQAKQQGQSFDLMKLSQRSVYINQTQKQDAKTLIKLIGLPLIQSPSQAQPQCSQIVKSGLAYGTISQDMDTLPFGCPRIIRNFNIHSNSFIQINLQSLLQQIQLSHQQFIDFCILCGCDYSDKINRIGPATAYKFIKQFGNIDQMLIHISKDPKLCQRYTYTDQFNYFQARKIFKNPLVRNILPSQIQLGNFNQNQIISFLKSKQFSPVRISNWLKRMHQTVYFSKS